MAEISYASQALSDLERIADFLSKNDVDAIGVLDLIDEALSLLARHLTWADQSRPICES